MTEARHSIETKIQELLAEYPELFLVNIKMDAKNNVKVFLDGDAGIAIGQCAAINRQLYKFLEEAALFPNNDFSLEVSSPGIDEPLLLLRQYTKNTGRKLEVLLKDGTKLEGKLLEAGAETMQLEVITGKGKKAVTTVENIEYINVKTAIVQVTF